MKNLIIGCVTMVMCACATPDRSARNVASTVEDWHPAPWVYTVHFRFYHRQYRGDNERIDRRMGDLTGKVTMNFVSEDPETARNTAKGKIFRTNSVFVLDSGQRYSASGAVVHFPYAFVNVARLRTDGAVKDIAIDLPTSVLRELAHLGNKTFWRSKKSHKAFDELIDVAFDQLPEHGFNLNNFDSTWCPNFGKDGCFYRMRVTDGLHFIVDRYSDKTRTDSVVIEYSFE